MSSLRSQDPKGQVTGAEVLPPRASHGLTPVRMTPGLQVPLMRDGLWKHAPYACPRISPGEILKPPSILTGRPGVLVAALCWTGETSSWQSACCSRAIRFAAHCNLRERIDAGKRGSMAAKGGIEPPTRGFFVCQLQFAAPPFCAMM